jgi:hypothetical protein
MQRCASFVQTSKESENINALLPFCYLGDYTKGYKSENHTEGLAGLLLLRSSVPLRKFQNRFL